MNSNRRAELQRKLSMDVVPRPPADLADRIKADIPKYLKAEPETRSRFGGTSYLNLRLAASLLIVITAGIVTVQLITPAPEQQFAVTSTAAPRNVAPSAKMAQAATDEVRVDIRQAPAVQVAEVGTQEGALERMAPPPPSGSAMPREVARIEAERLSETDSAAGPAFQSVQEIQADRNEPVATSVADDAYTRDGLDAARKTTSESETRTADAGLAAPAPQPARTRAESVTVTAEAPLVETSRRPSAPAPAAAGARIAPAPPPSRSVAAHAPSADAVLPQTDTVFGISVDPGVFLRIKSELENGRRPDPASVDIDALVNYFAGAPGRAPHGVRLEVEASPAPVDTEGEHAVLRFTVDTPQVSLAPGKPAPAAATGVRLSLDVNRDVVTKINRIGSAGASPTQSTLPMNLSVTGLYGLDLKKGLLSTARVATVTLEYTSLEDGRRHRIERVIHGHDLARTWTQASRRHRLASLGALWGESLRGTASGADIARRADEIATQNPADIRARELANAASVTPGER